METFEEDNLCCMFLDLADEQKSVKVWSAMIEASVADEAWRDIIVLAHTVVENSQE